MSIMKRRTDKPEPPAEQELYGWIADLPPHATVHVRESGSAYIGSFLAGDVPEDAPIEEYLMDRYGAGVFELAAHSDGVFLAGRQTVHLGSYAERQAARHRQATHDADSGTGVVAQMQQWADLFKQIGLIRDEPQDDSQSEIIQMLMQQAVQTLRPRDPTTDLEQAFGFYKSMREFEKSSSPELAPRPRPEPRGGKSSKAKRDKAVGELLGTALFIGADLALRNPDTARRVGDGVTSTARKAGDWFRRRVQTPPATAGAADEGPTIDAASLTLDEAMSAAKALAQTPIGQRMLDTARSAMPELSPEQIARQGLDGARAWLGPNHPLLLRLREDPARVFDEVADVVGLAGELRWRARGHFLGIMAAEERSTAQAGADRPNDHEETADHWDAEEAPTSPDGASTTPSESSDDERKSPSESRCGDGQGDSPDTASRAQEPERA
jgi:hypothetical protein